MAVRFVVKVEKKEEEQEEVTLVQHSWGVQLRVGDVNIAAIQNNKKNLQLYELPHSLRKIFDTDSRGRIETKRP